jgi:hypothetical protein
MKKNTIMVTVVVVVVVVVITTTTNNVTEASAPLTPKPAIGRTRILQLVLPISNPNNLSP